MTDEVNLRWACLQLASSREWIWESEEAMKLAEAYIAFLLAANAGRGIEHNAANLHRTHPTIQ